ncbi:diphthine synthase [Candidatus Pacearchaeota archaeon]|nr:diphthine synthase [Candidatus Pacearchaeota archaeon]
MLYLIGIGLSAKGVTLEALEAINKSSKIYLESYTVDFPYKIGELEKTIKKKIDKLDRASVESDKIILEAKKENVCLLVYGSPLFATTHVSLIMDADKSRVKVKIIYSASVLDGIAETGLQLYKFGKISSMPKWQKNFEPDSFLDFILKNQSINAHSLILVDIGLLYLEAIIQFNKVMILKNLKFDDVIVCSNLGTDKSKIYYGKFSKLKKKDVVSPFCFIIPADMHFLEKESIERFRV